MSLQAETNPFEDSDCEESKEAEKANDEEPQHSLTR